MNITTHDTELWEDFRQGDTYALAHIYHLYINQLYRYGKKFSNDDGMIKDTIQDLFFDLIRTRNNLGSTDHIYFYLIKALRRRLCGNLNKTKLILPDEVIEMQASNFIYSIEEDLIQKEELSAKEEMVRKALGELSPKQREILYYRFTCDFEYDQICEIMSMKYDSARKMVFRAFETFKRFHTSHNVKKTFAVSRLLIGWEATTALTKGKSETFTRFQ